jgi:hypothetical protein
VILGAAAALIVVANLVLSGVAVGLTALLVMLVLA